MGLISFLSSIDNKRSLKRLNKEAEEIIALKPSFEKLSDEELANKTQEFKDRLKNGEKAESLRKEAVSSFMRFSVLSDLQIGLGSNIFVNYIFAKIFHLDITFRYQSTQSSLKSFQPHGSPL